MLKMSNWHVIFLAMKLKIEEGLSCKGATGKHAPWTKLQVGLDCGCAPLNPVLPTFLSSWFRWDCVVGSATFSVISYYVPESSTNSHLSFFLFSAKVYIMIHMNWIHDKFISQVIKNKSSKVKNKNSIPENVKVLSTPLTLYQSHSPLQSSLRGPI